LITVSYTLSRRWLR